jgi:hypothetical protein
MANHSTNINKTNNHLSSYRTEHKKTTLEIYGQAWDRITNMAELNRLMGWQPSIMIKQFNGMATLHLD